jgi:hypothetical protein
MKSGPSQPKTVPQLSVTHTLPVWTHDVEHVHQTTDTGGNHHTPPPPLSILDCAHNSRRSVVVRSCRCARGQGCCRNGKHTRRPHLCGDRWMGVALSVDELRNNGAVTGLVHDDQEQNFERIPASQCFLSLCVCAFAQWYTPRSPTPQYRPCSRPPVTRLSCKHLRVSCEASGAVGALLPEMHQQRLSDGTTQAVLTCRASALSWSSDWAFCNGRTHTHTLMNSTRR